MKTLFVFILSVNLFAISARAFSCKGIVGTFRCYENNSTEKFHELEVKTLNRLGSKFPILEFKNLSTGNVFWLEVDWSWHSLSSDQFLEDRSYFAACSGGSTYVTEKGIDLQGNEREFQYVISQIDSKNIAGLQLTSVDSSDLVPNNRDLPFRTWSCSR